MATNDLKLKVLVVKFDELKDAYYECDDDRFLFSLSLAQDIIAPVLDIDAETGAKMWEYILQKYYNKIFEVDYSCLTEYVIDYTTSFDSLVHAFSTRDVICNCVALNPNDSHLYFSRFIAELIYNSNFKLAQKLIDLLLSNKLGNNIPEKNLFELCDWYVMHSRKSYPQKVSIYAAFKTQKKGDKVFIP